jgi:HK97 family phage prohead protease
MKPIVQGSVMKIKSQQGAITDVDANSGIAKIQFATYNTADRDKDTVFPGAFTKSWQEFKDVRFFLNHDKLQAPGKIQKLWDDKAGAYTEVKMGRHTLGQDVLKQMQDEIITDASYLMYPTKWDNKAGGGMNVREAFHKETSVLTHWGAHPGSKVMSVSKALQELEIANGLAKQLNADELDFLRTSISDMNDDLTNLVTFAAGLDENSDLYTWLNDVISSLSYAIQRFKSQLVWGQKEWSVDDLKTRLTKLKSFAHNSTASDECIQNILKEADEIESLLNFDESTLAATKALKQPEGISDEKIKFYNLNLLLDQR